MGGPGDNSSVGAAWVFATGGYSSVSAGRFHTCAVRAGDGTVVCWGDNSSGQTVVPATVGAVTQVSADGYHTCAVKASDGTGVCWGDNIAGENNVPATLGAVKQVSAGFYHTCAVKASDGTVVCWGFNGDRETAVPATLGAVKQLSAGAYHTCAVKASDGTAVCWGKDLYGETEVPAIGAVTQVSAGYDHTCAVEASDGAVVCWGDNSSGQTAVPATLRAVTQVSAGGFHTCAVKASDGTVVCWGYNTYGQTDVPATLGAVTQVSAGYLHTCAVNGTIVCWGDNTYGQSTPPPSNTKLPVISGTVQDGQTLKVTSGSWSSPDALSYHYQWQRCDGTGSNCVNVAGATASSRKLTSADVSAQITVVVTATDKENQTGQATAIAVGPVIAPAAPLNTKLPVISGTTQDGQTLKVTSGSWSSPDPLTYHYQWQRCDSTGANCVNVAGATTSSRKLTSADVSAQITAVVTATDRENQTGQATAIAVGPVTAPPPPSNTSLPVIAGTAQDGQTLTVAKGSWSSPDPLSYHYQWQRCDSTGANCVNVAGATTSSRKLTSADVGAQITAVVSATDRENQTGQATAIAVGPVTAPPPPSNTSLPVIAGTAQDGQTLTVAKGSWSSPDPLSYHYQWQRCDSTGANCVNVAGATTSSRKLTSADVGAQITAVVSATDRENQTGQATAIAVGPVTAPPPPSNTSLPVIAGTAQDGQTLTVAKGSWSSPDPLSYHYQWQRCDSTGANCVPTWPARRQARASSPAPTSARRSRRWSAQQTGRTRRARRPRCPSGRSAAPRPTGRSSATPPAIVASTRPRMCSARPPSQDSTSTGPTPPEAPSPPRRRSPTGWCTSAPATASSTR